MVTISRGDIALCDLNPVIGTEQAGVRPVVVLQIDRANAASPHTIIAPFTTMTSRAFIFSCVCSRRRWGLESGFGAALRADSSNRQATNYQDSWTAGRLYHATGGNSVIRYPWFMKAAHRRYRSGAGSG